MLLFVRPDGGKIVLFLWKIFSTQKYKFNKSNLYALITICIYAIILHAIFLYDSYTWIYIYVHVLNTRLNKNIKKIKMSHTR